MAIFKVAWKGIKKRKVYSISILLLVFMMAALLNTGISVQQRVDKIYDETHAKANSIHLLYYFEDMYKEKVKQFEDWFEKDNRVKDVKVEKVIILEDEAYNFKDKGKAEPQVLLYPNKQKYLNTANKMINLDLDYDEIALPIYYQLAYDLKEGDNFDIFLDDLTISLKIDSFFVDPFYGSEMVGLKAGIINTNRLEDTIELSKKLSIDPNKIHMPYTIGIVANDAFIENVKEINDDFYYENEVPMNVSYTYKLIKTGTLYIANIMALIVIAFSIVLFLIILLVIRGAINSAIETDFTNIGILKSLGFTSSQILMTIILQFSSLAFLGTLLGIGISILAIPSIGNITLATTGLIWFGFPSVLTMLLILFILLVLINLIIYTTSHKAMKITPVEAISGGKGDVYFKSHVNVPLRKLTLLPLNLRIGLKQIVTKANQYVMLVIISVVLSFVVGITLLTLNIFSDTETTYRIFGFNIINIEVTALEEDDVANIMEEISRDYNVLYSNLKLIQNVLIGSESVMAMVSEDFEKGNITPVSGRFPKYDNEVTMTKSLADYFNKKVGDTLIISGVSGEKELEFIITGYHQNVNNMGKNMFLTSAGFKRIDQNAQLRMGELLIDKTLDLDKVVYDLEQKYENPEKGIDIIRSDYGSSMLISIKNILHIAVLGIFILVSIIITIIIMLLAFIVIHKENKELGVYKALGYDTLQMRLQLAARYGMVTLLGALMGSVLCSIVGADIIGILLSSIGVGQLELGFTLTGFLVPVGLVSIVAFLVSFLASKRIRTVSPRDLVCE